MTIAIPDPQTFAIPGLAIDDAPVVALSAPRATHGLPIGWLATAVLMLAAIGNLLLPAFLGLAPVLDGLLLLVGAGGIGLLAVRTCHGGERIEASTLAICLVIACCVLMLGGEGRFLSATTDWRIRDAVLADLGRHPWPFRYATTDGTLAILRAPLGMYLLPALAGGGGQTALDIALLAANTAMLGLLLALAASLFPAGKPRATALTIFLLFSGFDAVGTLLMRWMGHPATLFHMENWAPASQFTAIFTQISWAPQHALAGWACALFYLLWQQRKLPIGALAAAIPLFAFWSPVAAAGALPFAALAAYRSLRAIRVADVGLGAIAVAISIPALLYQHAGSSSVISGANPIAPGIYALAILLEVAPLVLPLLWSRSAHRFGRDALILATAMLLLAPLYRVGLWKDFQMRVTIVPIVLVAAAFADTLMAARASDDRRRARLLMTILGIGSLTVVSELFPILTMRAAPPPLCTVVTAWVRQPVLFAKQPPSAYLAPADALPALLRAGSVTTVDPARDPASCWSRPWFVPA